MKAKPKTVADIPALSAEWGNRNTLGPHDFTLGSNSVVEWKCHRGHEWTDTISHRTSGRKCPYCSGRRLSPENSLEARKPELLSEWDYCENSLDPPEISYGSKLLAGWVCKHGHKWKAKVYMRTKDGGTGCPICAGRSVTPSTSLFTLHPELKQEWDPNNTLDPTAIHPGTLKKVQWICPNGHQYSRSVRSRTVQKLGCDLCNSFGYTYPELISTWHRNNPKSPYDYSQGSGEKVQWICSEGHDWVATIASRRKHGCPFCSGQKATEKNNFAAAHPELVKNWDDTKNDHLPSEVPPSSNRIFYFICDNGHSFSAKLNNIHNGRWCPYCSNKKVGYGNSLLDSHPVLALQWHPTRNQISATEVSAGSSRKGWWVCPEGHEWSATIASRSAGNGCPYCINRYVGYGNSLQERYPGIASEIDQDKSPTDSRKIGAGSTTSLWWKCSRGHSWQAPVLRRTKQKSGCPYCSNQTSLPEIRIFCELKSIFDDAVARQKVAGVECDIFIPSLSVAVEYDGAYFHHEKSDSDARKRGKLFENGITLFRVREEPLPLNGNDIRIQAGRERLTKGDLNALVTLIEQVRPQFASDCSAYCREDGFRAEEEYRRIISYLPGPPEGDTLKDKYPSVGMEWNYSRNFPLTPDMFHASSGKKVWWKCRESHEWQAVIQKRTGGGRGCPYCSNKKVGYGNSLADLLPALAAEWHPTRNGELTPAEVGVGSGKPVWWRCQSGHEFQAKVTDRARRGSQCRFCSGVGRNRQYTPPLHSA